MKTEMKELEKKEPEQKELEQKTLDQINGGFTSPVVRIHDQKMDRLREEEARKEHTGVAEGTW